MSLKPSEKQPSRKKEQFWNLGSVAAVRLGHPEPGCADVLESPELALLKEPE